MPKDAEWEPVTDEVRAESAAAIRQLERDLAEATKRPRPPVTSPGKFTEPLGMDGHGNLQPPLTPQEEAHNEAVRRRGERGRDDPDMLREARAVGAVLGSAVGDALGAPFEFGPPMAFSARFPPGLPVGGGTEMAGGGGWEPGEATDDTQMALMVAESLLAHGGFDPADMFDRFRRWAAAGPKDIGLQTSAVLNSGQPWDAAAANHYAQRGHAAGNGSLMRTATAAVYYARHGRETTMDAARRISALTHGDPAAGEGCAIYHELIRVAIDGGDPLAALPDVLGGLAQEQQERWSVVLAPQWTPEQATESNGAVWPTLGSAVWALRVTTGFAEALRSAVDLGGDTDTVAAVTGGLAGAVHGAAAIPQRWTDPLFVPPPGADRTYRAADLRLLAQHLWA